MSGPDLREILDFSLSIAAEAEELILPLYQNVAVDHKADGSEVTAADKGAEELLRRRILERYPDHQILGEEFGGERSRDAEHLWFLDPIDGTASFAIGLPLFGTMIAYVRRGEPLVGLVNAPALGETTYAARGEGCWHLKRGGEPKQVRTSGLTDISKAYAISTSIEKTDLDPSGGPSDVRLSQLYRSVRRIRWSGDCINYTLLCQGRIDIAIDPRMNPWDIAPLVPLVLEAGGAMTGVDGGTDLIWQPSLIASATPELHRQALAALNENAHGVRA